MVWYSYHFKSFPPFVMIHTVKGFSVVNETEVDIFLEFLCFLYDPRNVGNLISGSSVFSKSNSDIWKISVHVLLKPSMQNIEHNLTSMGDECNCPVVWTFLSTALLGNWNENLPFPVLWFSKFADRLNAALLYHHFFRILNSSPGIPSPPLALLTAVFPKAHLTSHSGTSGSGWVTTPS